MFNRDNNESGSADCDSYVNVLRRSSLKPKQNPSPTDSPKSQSNNDRSFPYKLARFPSSVKTFWDRTPLGCSETLNWCNNRTPVVCLNKSVLNSGNQLLLDTNDDCRESNCLLQGAISTSESENIMTISLKSLIHGDSSGKRHSNRLGSMDYKVPIKFVVKSQSSRPLESENEFRDESTKWLEEGSAASDTVGVHRYMYFKAICEFDRVADGALCDVQFRISTLPFVFNLTPIRPVATIATALSKGLSDPSRNVFLHGEPKSGYVTIDQVQRLLLVLDSDPKATSLPLVGVWISGVESIRHPFVWVACTRYAKKGATGQTTHHPQATDSFLVLVYGKQYSNPDFFDCTLKPSSMPGELAVYSAKTSCQLSTASEEAQNDSLVINLTRVSRSETSSPAEAVLEKESLPITPTSCQRLRFTSPTIQVNQNRDEGRWPLVSDELAPASLHDVDVAPQLATVDSTPPSGSRSTPRCDTMPMGSDLHTVVMAQERQLRQLREELDSLLRDRRQPLSATVQDSESTTRTNDGSPITPSGSAAGATKRTECVATMTSFASVSTPSPAVVQHRCACSDSRQVEPEAKANASSASPELFRGRRQSDSSVPAAGSVDDSLVDLRLSSLTQPSESRASSLRVDLCDFSQSAASFSRHSNTLDSNTLDRETRMAIREKPTGTLSSIQEYFPSCSEDGDRSSFYDGLLKKIQDVLSQQDYTSAASPQTGDNDLTTCRRTSPKERSVFDSVLIPHLNYLTMYQSDLDTNQSAEFNVIAKKYLKILNHMSVPIQSAAPAK